MYSSPNGRDWKVLVDKSLNEADVPHDYVELAHPVQARYIKLENIHVPTGKFALSGLRVFGKGKGKKPASVEHFEVLRGDSERRSSWLRWQMANDAQGYTIYFGIAADKLYNNILVYGRNEYSFSGLEKDRAYYFQIEAFNQNGISERTPTLKVE
jgi:hypothetical protein